MGSNNSIAFVKKLWIVLFPFLLVVPNKLLAQPATLELHRIWEVDIDGGITALRLADLDGDGTNEIFVGVWDGDSGYIEVYSGFNGLLIDRSGKITDYRIVDMDVGNIDGDQGLEVVVAYNSSICVLDANELVLEWRGWIGGSVQCVEVHDINNDDTAEVFIGTSTCSSDGGYDDGVSWWEKTYWGALYYLNGKDKVLTCMDSSLSYRKLIAADINQDSFDEIVCGAVFAHETGADLHPGPSFVSGDKKAEIKVIDRNGSLSKLSTVHEMGAEYWSPPILGSVAIGDCDSDDELEIVTYTEFGPTYYDPVYGPSGNLYVLAITDASSGIVENSTFSVEANSAPALFDVDGQPPDEILVERTGNSAGIIVAINGTTFDTVAISEYLPAIRFFVFGDVAEDAMPEICISDGDNLFLYGFGPTGVEEEDEEDLASTFVLQQNFPNPFNLQTTIKYYLFKGSRVELSIYNIKGQKVKTLVDGFQTVGFQSVAWDGRGEKGARVASGIYFYRVKTDFSEETRKMVLMK